MAPTRRAPISEPAAWCPSPAGSINVNILPCAHKGTAGARRRVKKQGPASSRAPELRSSATLTTIRSLMPSKPPDSLPSQRSASYAPRALCAVLRPPSFLLLLLLGLLGAPLLAGCSNSPYPSADAGKAIIYSELSENPKSLDPSWEYTVSDGEVLANIDDTYLEYQYLDRNPLVLVPSMGARMPFRQETVFTEMVPTLDKSGKPVKDAHGHPLSHPVTRHGETWTFTIKRGIKFADDACFPGGKGRECTAADFIYSFKRMADPSVNCPILSYVLPHVVGLQQFFDQQLALMTADKAKHRQYTCDLQTPVRGLQVDPHDPYTFRVLLRDKYPQLKYLFAMTFTSPIPHEAVEYYNGHGKNDFRKHPVGTGPYYLAEWTENMRLVLKQNPYYHTDRYPSTGAPGDRAKGLLADAGKALPLTPEVVFTIVRQNMVGWTLFQQGYLDEFGVPKETFNKVVAKQGNLTPEMKARGIRLDHATGMDTYYFGFNMNDSEVGGYTPQKRKLRQALSLAFNTQEYLDLTSNGMGIPAQSVLPPGVFGYDPNYKNPYRQTNLEKAKQLLAEAGYPGGIDPKTGQRLEINYDNAANTPAADQEINLSIKQFNRLGIQMKSRPSTYSAFQDRVNNATVQFFSYGWVADYPDPENFYLLFYSENKAPGPNAANYSNPKVDALYRKMAAMDDTPERLKLIHQMRDIVQEDCPWIFNDHSEYLILRYAWLKNAKSNPVALNTLKYLRIDAGLRERDRAAWNRPAYGVVALFFGFLIVSALPATVVIRKRRASSARAARRTLVSRSDRVGKPDRNP